MIGRLKGILAHKQPPWLVVDVNGVGYELEAPMSTFYDLPETGREVALFTHYAQKKIRSPYGFSANRAPSVRDCRRYRHVAKIALASRRAPASRFRAAGAGGRVPHPRSSGIAENGAQRRRAAPRGRWRPRPCSEAVSVPADPRVNRRRLAAAGLQPSKARMAKGREEGTPPRHIAGLNAAAAYMHPSSEKTPSRARGRGRLGVVFGDIGTARLTR